MSDPTGTGPAELDQVDEVVSGPPRGARRAPLVAVVLILLVVLPLGLAVRAGWQPLLDLDRSVSDALVVRGRGTTVDMLRVLTAAGLLQVRLVVLVPLAIWFAAVRRWRLGAFLVVAGFGVSPVNGLLKLIFDRARPIYDGTLHVGGLSFPSGHSSGAAALAAILVVIAWPLLAGVWCWLWPTLAALLMLGVGYTRIALGAHFLSDVIAGWSFGIAWVLLLAAIFQVWPGQPGALPFRPGAVHS